MATDITAERADPVNSYPGFRNETLSAADIVAKVRGAYVALYPHYVRKTLLDLGRRATYADLEDTDDVQIPSSSDPEAVAEGSFIDSYSSVVVSDLVAHSGRVTIRATGESRGFPPLNMEDVMETDGVCPTELQDAQIEGANLVAGELYVRASDDVVRAVQLFIPESLGRFGSVGCVQVATIESANALPEIEV